MSRVYKYEFFVADDVVIEMPKGAIIIATGSQKSGYVCLWAIVCPDAPLEMRFFHVVGTGHPIPKGTKYVGTVFDENFVWHVFEDRSKQ